MRAEFTDEELRWFKAFVRVQRSNRYNMLDPRAAQAASLTKEQMVFVMDNYEELELVNDKGA